MNFSEWIHLWPVTAVFVAFGVTYASIQALKAIAHRCHWVAPSGPGSREKLTPVVGGVSIYLGTLAAVWLLNPNIQNSLMIKSILPILLLGLVDDFYKLKPISRLIIEVAVAWQIVYLNAGGFSDLGALWGSEVLRLEWLSIPFTVFVVVGLMNAVNLSDGLDGLAGGYVIVPIVMLVLLLLQLPQFPLEAYRLLAYAAALIAFLCFNFRFTKNSRAQVFMGDAGSLVAGLILAILAKKYTQGHDRLLPPVLMIWFLALPVMDTLCVMTRRVMLGRSPLVGGDRLHIHDFLIDAGVEHRKVVIILLAYAFMLAFAAYGAWLMGASESILLAMFLIWMSGHYFVMYQRYLWRVIPTSLTNNVSVDS